MGEKNQREKKTQDNSCESFNSFQKVYVLKKPVIML